MAEQDQPLLTMRTTYDAAEVDPVIASLRSELDSTRAQLDAALDRAERAERRAELAAADPAVLGRAMLLVQRAADEILEEAHREADAIRAAAGLAQAPTPPSVAEPTATAPRAESTLAEVRDRLRAAIDDQARALQTMVDVRTPDGEPASEHLEPAAAGFATEEPAAAGLTAEDDRVAATATDESPGWMFGRTNAPDDDGPDYFLALRQSLEDGEPLGPRDDEPAPRNARRASLNGHRRIWPVIRATPVVALLGPAAALVAAAIVVPALHIL